MSVEAPWMRADYLTKRSSFYRRMLLWFDRSVECGFISPPGELEITFDDLWSDTSQHRKEWQAVTNWLIHDAATRGFGVSAGCDLSGGLRNFLTGEPLSEIQDPSNPFIHEDYLFELTSGVQESLDAGLDPAADIEAFWLEQFENLRSFQGREPAGA